jgi:Fe-S cluster biosynthesis and repair protein YggX
MTHMIFCQKLKKEAVALAAPPYPGELGQRIYQHISQEAWAAWQKRQTMFINEYRLNLADPKSRALLEKEMVGFLFEEQDALPGDYQPPKE